MSWLSGWQYRKKITISGSSGAGTNYQVLLKVGESSGASGCNFHVEGHSANFPNADDNFNDNDLNTYLWRTHTIGAGTINEQNGRIEATTSGEAGTNGAHLYSNFFLGGDFDIQVDFSDLVLPDVYYTMARGLNFYVKSGTECYVERAANRYSFTVNIEGTAEEFYVESSDTSGKFRLTRVGNTVTGYYWNGNSWTQIGQKSGFPTGSSYLRNCWIYTDNGATASVNYNNFKINKGTITKPLSGDLRFTDNGGIALLDFWVEKVEGTSPNRVAHIWVEVKDDLGSNVDIYCYYGNSNATNVSSGANTFIFFDDALTDGSANYEWVDIYGTPFSPSLSYDATNNEYDLSHSDDDNEMLKLKNIDVSDCCIRGKFKVTQSDAADDNDQFGFWLRHSGLARPDDKGYFVRVNRWFSPNDRLQIKRADGGTDEASLANGDLSENVSLNSYYVMEVRVYGTEGNFSASLKKLDGTELASVSASDNTYSYSKLGIQYAYNDDTKISFKEIILRKYISPEPSFSSAGSEITRSEVSSKWRILTSAELVSSWKLFNWLDKGISWRVGESTTILLD